MNKKNGLKALLVLLIFCSLGIILKNIVEYESDGAVDVEVSEFISYQEIDFYTLDDLFDYLEAKVN